MICGGIVFLLYIALGLYAMISIIGSSASIAAKTLWILLVYFIPVLGWLLWFLAGPKARN